MTNLIDLSEKTGDAGMRSQKQALEDALSEIGKRGAFESGKKLIVLALDDQDGQYSISYVQAGMKMSECVTLCEISKTIFLKEMGYIS